MIIGISSVNNYWASIDSMGRAKQASHGERQDQNRILMTPPRPDCDQNWV
ncbi:MAG: hypothetical protein ACREUY_06960 [Burkholderiales bacterium]